MSFRAMRFHPFLLLNLLFLIAGLILAAPVPAQQSDDETVTPDLVPAGAVDILQDVSVKDGPVLLNFWATWCAPCREEMPDLLKLHDDFGDRGFDLMLVSADFMKAKEKAHQYLQELGVDFPTYIKDQKDDEFINAIHEDWSGSLPFSILFDSDGQMVHTWSGMLTYDEAAARIEPLLDDR